MANSDFGKLIRIDIVELKNKTFIHSWQETRILDEITVGKIPFLSNTQTNMTNEFISTELFDAENTGADESYSKKATGGKN